MVVGTYRYRLRSTCHSSEKYGPCECCGKHVTEVCHQTEERAYQLRSDEPIRVLGVTTDMIGWTHFQCSNLFGHEECLVARRR